MAIEIELKAWVTDPEALKKRLDDLAEFDFAYQKDDVYWGPLCRAPNASPAGFSLPPSGIRLRRVIRNNEDEQLLVTYKVKEVRDGIEVNDEREFLVSDREAFEDMLSRLALVPGASKKKKGWSWKKEDLSIELSHVEGLGWFIELEILAMDSDPETVAKARSRLLDFLEKTGIAGDRIEPRYYTELLKSV
ncbi:hypothetical protein AGMMS49928_07860 [Spirochaetia bacterium]|nr:hypothetical protein AGMMS49928_07860 [Spirochaetia bacterium]